MVWQWDNWKVENFVRIMEWNGREGGETQWELESEQGGGKWMEWQGDEGLVEYWW